MAESNPIPTSPRFQDLTGKPFGRLTVLSFAGWIDGDYQWNCLCECKAIVTVRGEQLRSRRTKSCGCLKKEAAAKNGHDNRRHGQSRHGERSPEWIAWSAMHQRCENERCRSYPDYGGRGIRICERWSIFENFLADIGPRPSSRHSLDRFPDNDGNYEPGNCRWATTKQQSRNKRVSRLLTHNGQTKCLADWADALGFTQSLLAARFRYGWSVERAFSTPMRAKRDKKDDAERPSGADS